ncbi:MAG: hypothetical protein ACXVAJ_06730, partial [Parachlamydiaceae bacterium]
MKSILSSLVSLFFAAPAFAYYTGTFSDKPVNVNARTHIIIVGNGSDLGDALLVASAAQARKYSELYPNEQVYLLSSSQYGSEEDLKTMDELGYRSVNDKGGGFHSSNVLEEMMAFHNIASVDVFSHSVAYYGIILDGKFNRLDPKADGYQKLKGNFATDAYAFLHGCNGGQFLAGILSFQWGIPVAGSFTGTDFQFLYENGGFYNDDERRPADSVKAKVNKKSFEKNVGCYTGSCQRLFPDNHVYNGYWGSFTGGGLGFYKWLCVNKSITERQCFSAMAKAALSYLSVKSLHENSPLADYKEVVQDWLCPADKRADCQKRLEAAVATGQRAYDPYDGASLQCDFKGCQAKFTCERIPLVNLLKSGSCNVVNLRQSNKTTTIV